MFFYLCLFEIGYCLFCFVDECFKEEKGGFWGREKNKENSMKFDDW